MRKTIGALVAIGLFAAVAVGGPAGAQIVFEPGCKGQRATEIGTAGPDTIEGTNGRDVIVALAGNDRIKANGGNDLICSGRGNDRVRGGKGSDRIFTRDGADFVRGGKSSDRLQTGADSDILLGDSGPNDLCLGGRPTRDRGLRGDFADRRRCETIRSATRITFLRAEEARNLAARMR